MTFVRRRTCILQPLGLGSGMTLYLASLKTDDLHRDSLIIMPKAEPATWSAHGKETTYAWPTHPSLTSRLVLHWLRVSSSHASSLALLWAPRGHHWKDDSHILVGTPGLFRSPSPLLAQRCILLTSLGRRVTGGPLPQIEMTLENARDNSMAPHTNLSRFSGLQTPVPKTASA